GMPPSSGRPSLESNPLRFRVIFLLAVLVVAGLTLVPARSAQGPALPGPHDEQAALAAGRAAAASANPQSASVHAAAAQGSAGQFVTYRVFATQYQPNTAGRVEVAVPDKCVKFAALNLSTASCPPGYFTGQDYRVIVTL